MDRTTLARKLREALFDHIETGRREALQDSAIDALFERVLACCGVCLPAPADATLSGGDWGVAVGDVNLETMSVYAHKDGKLQWVSIHVPDFAKALADARTILVS